MVSVLTSIVAMLYAIGISVKRVIHARMIVVPRFFAETGSVTLLLGKHAKHAQVTVASVKSRLLKKAFVATMSVTLGRIVRLVRMIVVHVL